MDNRLTVEKAKALLEKYDVVLDCRYYAQVIDGRRHMCAVGLRALQLSNDVSVPFQLQRDKNNANKSMKSMIADKFEDSHDYLVGLENGFEFTVYPVDFENSSQNFCEGVADGLALQSLS